MNPAYHIVHLAPVAHGMGNTEPLGGAGVFGDVVRGLELYLDVAATTGPVLAPMDPIPAWMQRIPRPDPASRMKFAPDAKTLGKLRARRKR